MSSIELNKAVWDSFRAPANVGLDVNPIPLKEEDNKEPPSPVAEIPKDERFTYDMVMVLKVGDAAKKVKVVINNPDEKGAKKKQIKEMTEKDLFKERITDLLHALEKAGLKIDLWYSVQKDEIYCRLGATEHRLEMEADRINYDLQLDHTKCLEAGKAYGIRLAKATGASNGVSHEAWMNVFGPYKQLDPKHPFRQELYYRYYEDRKSPHYKSFFKSTDRIKLTVAIIETDPELGGAGLSTSKLISNPGEPLDACFPLHETAPKDALMAEWFHFSSTFRGPLQKIRDYFGESIAIYFAFLGFYNRALVIPAVIGIAFFIDQLVEGRVDTDAIPAYAILICFWASLFLEFWKRHEARYRLRWGMTKFLEKELPRPEFKGEWLPSPIDGRITEIFPFHEKLYRAILSHSVIVSLVGIVLACVVGIFFIRSLLQNWNPVFGGYVTAIINAIEILVLNYVYGEVANKLNDYENHRTDSEYENALIAKTFVFKFVNSYNTLFYIAFFKKYDLGCAGFRSCLEELRVQLGTIFIAAIVVNNALEVGVPIIRQRIADYQNRQEIGVDDAGKKEFKQKSVPEEEYELAPYDSTFDDFDELIVQYGYVTLFVVSFPVAPFLALFNNVFETRIDALKVCKLSRRPEPRSASNIGTWYSILDIISLVAVVTNCAIICFAADRMSEWTNGNNAYAAYAFILAEHFIFLIKFMIAFFVPDEPRDYFIHIARQEYIVNVLLLGMEEEDEDVVLDKDELMGGSGAQYDWSKVSDDIRLNTGHEC